MTSLTTFHLKLDVNSFLFKQNNASRENLLLHDDGGKNEASHFWEWEQFCAVRSSCQPMTQLLLLFRAALDFLLNILFHGCVDFLLWESCRVSDVVVLSKKKKKKKRNLKREEENGRASDVIAEFETNPPNQILMSVRFGKLKLCYIHRAERSDVDLCPREALKKSSSARLW